MKQIWQRQENRDWTYSEGCGCKVTFFAESNYKTSRMLPGETCIVHKDHMAARDNMVERARQSLKEYLELPLA